jgi:hypothetical protein
MPNEENESVVLPVEDAEQVLVAVYGIGRYEAENRLATIDYGSHDEIVAAYKANDLQKINSILSTPSPE